VPRLGDLSNFYSELDIAISQEPDYTIERKDFHRVFTSFAGCLDTTRSQIMFSLPSLRTCWSLNNRNLGALHSLYMVYSLVFITSQHFQSFNLSSSSFPPL